MYKYKIVTDKVGMAIFNLEVKDLNRLVEFKEIYALDSCGVPIFGVNDIAGIKIGCIYPALAFHLEGMCFSALNDLAVNIKLDQSINLIDGGRDNALFGSFAGDMIYTGNGIAALDRLC